MAQAQRWVGKPIPRRDALEKAIGQAKYASDLFPEGLLWGKVLRSKYPHAKIRRIDVSRAKSHPGVVAVFTHEDVPNNRYGLFNKDRPVLCDDKVRYIGDPIAVVAAETPEAAEEALGMIEVEYEPLPAVLDPLEAMKPESPKVHERGNIARQTHISFGDVEQAFREADVIVENTYTVGTQIHAYLETEAGISYFDENGRLTIVAGGQSPYRDRHEICSTLNIPEDSVRVVIPHVGGAFGGKDDISVQIHLALITLKTRRPARLVWTREESTIAGTKRHAGIIRMKTAARRDGVLLANRTEIIYDTGAYEGLGPAVLDVAIENCNGPYKIPNIDISATLVYTNNYVASAFRGFGAPQVLFAIESQLDAIAERLNMDPIELRLRNALRRGDVGVFNNKLIGSVGIAKALEIAANHELWRERERYKAETARPWIKRGVGVASAIKGYTLGALPDKGQVGVELTREGKFRVRVSSTEIGQGVLAALAQVAADMLRCGVDDIQLVFADTLETPDTSVTSASRQLFLAGNALADAARKMLDKMRHVAAGLSGEPPEVFDFLDGYAISRDGKTRISYAEIARYMENNNIPPHVVGEYEVPRVEPIPGTLEIPHLFYMFAAALALVEVNTLTGFAQVRKLVVIPDAGKVINPQTFQGQIEGAAVQGIGYALMEEAKIENGILKTQNFATYLIPSIKDAPEIEVIPVEDGEETGPFGAKGIGEIGIIPIAPAVANAIKDAVGVRPTSIPITPEKLYWLIRSKHGEKGSH